MLSSSILPPAVCFRILIDYCLYTIDSNAYMLIDTRSARLNSLFNLSQTLNYFHYLHFLLDSLLTHAILQLSKQLIHNNSWT